MTRREAGIVAFAALTAGLVFAILVNQSTPGVHPPALSGQPPPTANPANPTNPGDQSTRPSPTPSAATPRTAPGPPMVALNRVKGQEDESEDEPPSAEGGATASSRSTTLYLAAPSPAPPALVALPSPPIP